MRRSFSVMAVVCLIALSQSCARNQHLTSIQIQPAGATFGAVDPTLYINFKAYGTYIHPPENKDITDQVTWQSDNPQVDQVSNTGVVSPNLGCGSGNVSATFQDSNNLVVSNSAHVIVDGPASSGCTPAGPQPILTVAFAGSGSGTVVSSPGGLDCTAPTACSNQFSTGMSITLTATPTGTSSFAGWSGGCSSSFGTSCTVILEGNATVTATFN